MAPREHTHRPVEPVQYEEQKPQQMARWGFVFGAVTGGKLARNRQ
jgi:hypothetical protein